MGHADLQPSMTAQDFLVWDRTQTVRHEFVDGEVFAMASGEDRHVTVTANAYMALRQHLTGTPCRGSVRISVFEAGFEFVFARCSLNRGPCQAAGGAPG